MKEIYILNKGDSVEKAKKELNLVGEFSISRDKVFNRNYINIHEGLDDVIVINNYLPYYLYKVKSGETVMDILSKGYDVQGVSSVNEGDLIVVSKPKSIRYVVKPLETLDEISMKFNIDKSFIMDTNNLSTDKLFIGQILWI